MKYGIKIFGYENLNIYLKYLTNQPHIKILSIISNFEKRKYFNIAIEKIQNDIIEANTIVIDNISQINLKKNNLECKNIIFIKSSDFINSSISENSESNYYIFNILYNYYRQKKLISYFKNINLINKINLLFPNSNNFYSKDDFLFDFVSYLINEFSYDITLEKISKNEQYLNLSNKKIHINILDTKNKNISFSFDDLEKIELESLDLSLEFFFNNTFLDIVENKANSKIFEIYNFKKFPNFQKI